MKTHFIIMDQQKIINQKLKTQGKIENIFKDQAMTIKL